MDGNQWHFTTPTSLLTTAFGTRYLALWPTGLLWMPNLVALGVAVPPWNSLSIASHMRPEPYRSVKAASLGGSSCPSSVNEIPLRWDLSLFLINAELEATPPYGVHHMLLLAMLGRSWIVEPPSEFGDSTLHSSWLFLLPVRRDLRPFPPALGRPRRPSTLLGLSASWVGQGGLSAQVMVRLVR